MPTRGSIRVLPNGDVDWVIPDLESPAMEDDVLYRSPDFDFGGEKWCLWIYPNGDENRDSVGYLDVGLWRCTSSAPPIPMRLSVALKTVDGQKDSKRQGLGIFKRFDVHYINRLFSRPDYERRKSEFLISGCFTIVCTMEIFSTDKSLEDLRKKLEETIKEKDDIKKELYASNADNEILLKAKLDLEADLKTIRENLAEAFENQRIELERTVKEKDDIKKELDASKAKNEILLKAKLDLEADLKTIRENLGAANTSASPEVRHHDKILQDFKKLYLNQENCDVILRVKGQEFQAHKLILMARSPVFASTFQNDMKEKETGIVDIEDCDPSVFPAFLCFLYSDDVDSFSDENVFGLFTVADKYDITDLRRMCLEFMKENLSIETFCETLTLALQHSENDLIRLATNFFIKNAEKILVTVKWQSFSAENPTQSNELFIKFLASDRCLKS